MRIKYIHVKNFKSFSDQKIDLGKLNILLGANASGKSNTVSIIRFVNNILLYGIDDAISLLGGINYAINATIGKMQPMYLKFILDISDENWIRNINRKEGKGLLLEEAISEFVIIPHKRGMGYKIGRERLDIKYKACKRNEKDDKGYIIIDKDYVITYKRVGNRFQNEVINNTSFEDESLNEGFGAQIITNIMSEDLKELILNKLDYMMPPMFNVNDFIKIYDFDPRLMKISSSITSKRRLEEDGSNIANVLQEILRNKNDKNKLLNLLCDCLPFVDTIDVQNNVDKSVSYRIKEKYNNKTFYSNFLSDGTVNMLALIIALYFESPSGIIIIEEPERNLHPQLMSKIVEMAIEMSEEKQIVITTHNPELVKYSETNFVLFAQRTSEGFTKISRPSDSVMVQQFIDSDLGLEDLFVKDLLGD